MPSTSKLRRRRPNQFRLGENTNHAIDVLMVVHLGVCMDSQEFLFGLEHACVCLVVHRGHITVALN